MSDMTRRDLMKGSALAASMILAESAAPAAVSGQTASGSIGARETTASMSTGVQRALPLVDPELRAQARQMADLAAQMPPVGPQMLPGMRSRDASPPPFLPNIPVLERRVPGRRGQPDVTVYVINARPDGARPGILDIHGGGFIIGSARSSVPALQQEAQKLDCVIVSVEYRLAPETTWQGSTEDTYAALEWLYDKAATLGIDRSRIAISGGSAGGGHAALLAIAARNRRRVPVRFLALSSAMLDDRTVVRNVPEHIGTFTWTRELNHFGWRSFLGQEPGGPSVPANAVPARVKSLVGLPRTFISVGALDLFVNENIEFAQRLINDGVSTELFVAPGVFHGAGNAAITRQIGHLREEAFMRAFALAPDG